MSSLTLDQARDKFINSVSCQQAKQTVSLQQALLRVAANAVVSEIAVPPTDNSAMDGFAVNAEDLSEGETELKISQRIPAGIQPSALVAGTAARIFTGGVLPQGADTVVIQEHCEFNAECATVRVLKPVRSGENIRRRGQDISIGAKIISRGKRLSAVDLGLLASVGKAKASVFQAIRVAVFATGNELVEPGLFLKHGQIYNSNRTMLLALCEQLGYTSVDCGIVVDTLDATKMALTQAAKQADVILTSGGVSVGDEDYIKPAIEQLGKLNHWKVQMKPGKPVVLGNIASTPIIGLPGNPVSSFVVFQLLAVPLLQTLQGQLWSPPNSYVVSAGFEKSTVLREEYIRVRLCTSSSRQLTAELFDNQSSGVLSSLSWADGLVRQTINQVINKGDEIEFLPFKEGLL